MAAYRGSEWMTARKTREFAPLLIWPFKRAWINQWAGTTGEFFSPERRMASINHSAVFAVGQKRLRFSIIPRSMFLQRSIKICAPCMREQKTGYGKVPMRDARGNNPTASKD